MIKCDIDIDIKLRAEDTYISMTEIYLDTSKGKVLVEHCKIRLIFLLNLFLVNVLILYPLKTSEKQSFPGVFRGYKMGTLAKTM